MYRLTTKNFVTDRQRDRRTDHSIMPMADGRS